MCDLLYVNFIPIRLVKNKPTTKHGEVKQEKQEADYVQPCML